MAEGPIPFDSYPNHHCYEISVNGADFQDVGKGHYMHGPFKKSYIKTITTAEPYDANLYYKLGDTQFDELDSVRIRMIYTKLEYVDADVWTGELLSQEYTLKDKAPNK